MTSVSGVALSNYSVPILGVEVRVRGSSPLLKGTTDVEGRFNINGVPSGRIHLDVVPTATGNNQAFPPLAFEMDITAGVDNVMDWPMYLPIVDSIGGGTANPDSDIVLSRYDTPGLVFTVKGGFGHVQQRGEDRLRAGDPRPPRQDPDDAAGRDAAQRGVRDHACDGALRSAGADPFPERGGSPAG